MEWTINFNKRNASKECDNCYYWYLLIKGFNVQLNVCNRCHDILMMSINLSNIYILNIKNTDYGFIITGISKIEAKKLLKTIDLTEKSRTWKNGEKMENYIFKNI